MLIELAAVAACVAVLSALLARLLRRLPLGVRIAFSVAISAVLVVYAAWTISRKPWQLMGETFAGTQTAQKVVALTFDDGPTRKWTQPVLDVLAREGVRATFFLIGESVDANLAEARAIVAAGHEVGNHTYTHPRMVLHSPAFVREEVERTDVALRRAGWATPALFRSPFCKKFLVLPYYLSRHGRVNVFWDVDADSTPALATDAASLAARVVARAHGGSVILMHVMYDGRETSRAALPLVIRGLRGRGFSFVTVSALMRRSPSGPPRP